MSLSNLFKSLVAVAATAVVITTLTPAMAEDLTGAGATFPYPIYAKWADAYKKASGNGLNYQSVGSGAGIKQIKSKTVDFGASDMPLKADELEAAGLIQFPAIMGGLVPVVNLEGVAAGKMKLTGEVIADIYLGKITKWNAPQIVALNPDLKLPATDITVVHRSDGSGSTFLWTDYLSKVNAEFKTAVGSSTAVKWPVGLGGKGNEGVAASVLNVKGSIGYVEYAYVKKNKMIYASIKNKDGNFVEPSDDSFKAAAAGADWAKSPGYYVILTNQSGKASWPITGASFILMYKQQADATKGREVLKFFDWSFNNGEAMANELDYVAMPPAVIKLVQETWKSEVKDSAGKPIW
jgi:phosphate transport system substrate-binding protein